MDDLVEDNDVTEQLSVFSFVSDHEDIKKAQISRKGKSRQVTARSSNLDVNVADLCPEKRDRSHNSSNRFVDSDQPVNEVRYDAEAGPSHSIKSERRVSSHVQIGGQDNRAKGNGQGTGMLHDHVDGGNVYLTDAAFQSAILILTIFPQRKKVFINQTRHCYPPPI